MEIYLAHIAAAQSGAACLGAVKTRSAQETPVSVAGVGHALESSAVLTAGTLGARPATFRPAPARTGRTGAMTVGYLPAANGNRKQTNVHMTRIDAGGNGAMGPYPEREQPPA